MLRWGNSNCSLVLKIIPQHLSQPYLHCLEPIEEKRKWLSQFCTYQYMEIGPGLAKMEVIALYSRRVIQVILYKEIQQLFSAAFILYLGYQD